MTLRIENLLFLATRHSYPSKLRCLHCMYMYYKTLTKFQQFIWSVGVELQYVLARTSNPLATDTYKSEYKTFKSAIYRDFLKNIRYIFDDVIVEVFEHSRYNQISRIVMHIRTWKPTPPKVIVLNIK